jgi:hypothetical protein
VPGGRALLVRAEGEDQVGALAGTDFEALRQEGALVGPFCNGRAPLGLAGHWVFTEVPDEDD